MDWGDKECCGCLMIEERGDVADLVCNECGVVVRTVARSDLHPVVTEMSLAGGFAHELCPHCGSVNLFPGFSEMMAYRCRECGKGVAKS